jgi:hypothetical protein
VLGEHKHIEIGKVMALEKPLIGELGMFHVQGWLAQSKVGRRARRIEEA